MMPMPGMDRGSTEDRCPEGCQVKRGVPDHNVQFAPGDISTKPRFAITLTIEHLLPIGGDIVGSEPQLQGQPLVVAQADVLGVADGHHVVDTIKMQRWGSGLDWRRR